MTVGVNHACSRFLIDDFFIFCVIKNILELKKKKHVHCKFIKELLPPVLYIA